MSSGAAFSDKLDQGDNHRGASVYSTCRWMSWPGANCILHGASLVQNNQSNLGFHKQTGLLTSVLSKTAALGRQTQNWTSLLPSQPLVLNNTGQKTDIKWLHMQPSIKVDHLHLWSWRQIYGFKSQTMMLCNRSISTALWRERKRQSSVNKLASRRNVQFRRWPSGLCRRAARPVFIQVCVEPRGRKPICKNFMHTLAAKLKVLACLLPDGGAGARLCVDGVKLHSRTWWDGQNNDVGLRWLFGMSSRRRITQECRFFYYF